MAASREHPLGGRPKATPLSHTHTNPHKITNSEIRKIPRNSLATKKNEEKKSLISNKGMVSDFFGTGQIARQQREMIMLLLEIRDLLKTIEADLRAPPVPKFAVAVRLFRKIDGQLREVRQMGFQLQDVQSVPLTIAFVDADQNPTPAPAGVVPVWSTSDGTKVAVTPAADGMSAVAAGTGGLGDAQINVTAGAITGQWPVTLVAGPPAAIVITPGAPTP